MSAAKKQEEYGMLGAHDGMEERGEPTTLADKMVSSLLNSVLKNLDKQLVKDLENCKVTGVFFFRHGISSRRLQSHFAAP